MAIRLILSIFQTPFEFLNSLVGARNIQLEENMHLFKLGKTCSQCRKLILYRDTISVCQCYCFAHTECLKTQLVQQRVAECSRVNCKTCEAGIKVNIEYKFSLQFRLRIKDLVTLLICFLVCAMTLAYLIIMRNQYDEQDKDKLLLSVTKQIGVSIIFVIFGSSFWFCLMGVIVEKETFVRDIQPTNIEVKISAFEQLEMQMKKDSLQAIYSKRQCHDL